MLTKQYEALLATEDLKLTFSADAVKRPAEIAYAVNEKTENIGARRLYTVMENCSRTCPSTRPHGGVFTVDAAYVDGKLAELAQSEDLARYVL